MDVNTYIHGYVCTCTHEYTLKPSYHDEYQIFIYLHFYKQDDNASPHTMKDATGVPPDRLCIYVRRA